MDEALLDELLAGRYIATLATEDADGSISLAAVWFLHEEGVVYVGTGGRSRKARNAAARPRAAIMVDARGLGKLFGAAASGPVAVLRGDDAREINERIWAKYLTPVGLAAPDVGGVIRAHDDVALRLVPDGWRTWNTGDDFGGALERPGIAYPVE